MTTIVDPPSGWMYGFPKPLPEDRPADWNFRGWLIENGYPEIDADFAVAHCRQWDDE